MTSSPLHAPGIHPTAVIDPSSKIGARVSVGPYAVIGPECEIGDDVWIGPHAVVEYATVGAGCRIHPHAFVGTEPQDLKFKGEKTRAVIGANTTIRECVTVHRGTTAAGVTRVGANCLLMAYVHIAHDCVVADNVIMANVATLAGHVEVGPGAFIGGLSAVHQFTRLGGGAMIGGGAMVASDVPPYCMVHGNRAKVVGLNVVGLRRRKVSREGLSALKAAYRTLYFSNLSLAAAIATIEQGPRTPELEPFLAFLKQGGPRGLCRPARGASADDEAKDIL
jgi:UDP-N-acetylglucosamine acyltransferase